MQPPGEPSESLEARLRFETLLADIASREEEGPIARVKERLKVLKKP